MQVLESEESCVEELCLTDITATEENTKAMTSAIMKVAAGAGDQSALAGVQTTAK